MPPQIIVDICVVTRGDRWRNSDAVRLTSSPRIFHMSLEHELSKKYPDKMEVELSVFVKDMLSMENAISFGKDARSTHKNLLYFYILAMNHTWIK